MVKQKKETSDLFQSWSFRKENYILFGFGLVVILIGYILMATGETTSFQAVKLAPIILVIGYCIIIPIAILYRPKK